jgi:hypothetical protein
MSLYNIYAGLSGGFGDAEYKGTADFDSEAEALQEAYELAVAEYQEYEGCHGILGWGDVAEENNLYEETDEDLINELYQQEIESWIDYYVILTDEDQDIDKDEICKL